MANILVRAAVAAILFLLAVTTPAFAGDDGEYKCSHQAKPGGGYEDDCIPLQKEDAQGEINKLWRAIAALDRQKADKAELDQLEARINALQQALDGLDERVGAIEHWRDAVQATLDDLLSQIGEIAVRQAMTDAHQDRRIGDLEGAVAQNRRCSALFGAGIGGDIHGDFGSFAPGPGEVGIGGQVGMECYGALSGFTVEAGAGIDLAPQMGYEISVTANPYWEPLGIEWLRIGPQIGGVLHRYGVGSTGVPYEHTAELWAMRVGFLARMGPENVTFVAGPHIDAGRAILADGKKGFMATGGLNMGVQLKF